MNIVVLGSGNVASHLVWALDRAGETIVQIYSRNLDHATQLALSVNSEAIDDLDEISKAADIYIIAIKDSAISEVLKSLKKVKGLVAHTSGSTSLTVFGEEIKNFGVFYPLQTFSKHRDVAFAEIPICIEANKEENLQVLEDLGKKLSNKVYHINSHKRKSLHLAAVFAGNFSNHMYALAEDILKIKGLSFDLLKPLIEETAAKVMDNLPTSVQTGPAIRHDDTTIDNHLSLLDQSPDLHKVYKTVSDSIKMKYK